MVRSAVVFTSLALVGAADFPTFQEWQALHGKNYAPEQEVMRSKVYTDNVAIIAQRNSQDTAHYWPDEYADLTFEEWKVARGIVGFPHVQDGGPDQCNFENPNAGVLNSTEVLELAAGDSIDWREKGAVTPVKSQGSYGTCGYFSTIAVMEGINVVQGGNDLVSLSEQQNIDCCGSVCHGWPGEEIAWYDHKHQFAATDRSYPYRGPSGQCKTSSATLTPATSAGRLCIANDDPATIKAHLKTLGPAVWMIGCGCLGHGYRGGIVSDPSCKGSTGGWPSYSGIDHATTLVGYGEENGVEYWVVKNSWGADWGENGYYRVKIDEPHDSRPMLNAPGAIFGLWPNTPMPAVVV